MQKKKKLFNCFLNVLLAVLSIFILYPFFWMVGSSLKSTQDLYVDPWNLIPSTFLWENYVEAWNIGNIGRYFFNSVITVVFSLLIIVFINYLASYAISRIQFPLNRFIRTLFVATMMVPSQVIIIPLFKIQGALGIVNTRPGLILAYSAIYLPFSIFVMTSFLRSVPREIDEAAYVDGCNRFQIIWKILFPLTMPGLATIVIFAFMQIWNEFFIALVFIQEPTIKTLPLGIMNFADEWGSVDYPRQFAALVIINVPIILIYAKFQKQFISGLTAGALKG